jgi:hypothetical protein
MNRHGTDISEHTARLDDLMHAPGAVSIGVGDGGNEIGMGGVATYINEELGHASACATATDHLVLADVSNWGAYGLLAYLSRLSDRDLLPTNDEARSALEIMASMGAVNAASGLPEPAVDGFTSDEEAALLDSLRECI